MPSDILEYKLLIQPSLQAGLSQWANLPAPLILPLFLPDYYVLVSLAKCSILRSSLPAVSNDQQHAVKRTNQQKLMSFHPRPSTNQATVDLMINGLARVEPPSCLLIQTIPLSDFLLDVCPSSHAYPYSMMLYSGKSRKQKISKRWTTCRLVISLPTTYSRYSKPLHICIQPTHISCPALQMPPAHP
ncbi:hypothetical protein BO86DRAFT_110316 [Aspergillus japonicus CBS 114.51]|uniref:Uncharacterized protein n=1 Tax=Aspergillus japonicus CBS 114.51 TaxID=1448312 RepID=A0A8T8XGD9_ASPJA|nr:hypothetical protein BO86DRAFT_110316 [Aspergillus japonicus CBS 114.51]RAH86439.1 hypothetical protein BO86DRAFT_110316 [Aspergillus japonicus CBS 114.51]